MGFFDRRAIKKYMKEADKVIAYEKTMAALSNEELQAKGMEARQWVLDNKNHLKQTARIIELINN